MEGHPGEEQPRVQRRDDPARMEDGTVDPLSAPDRPLTTVREDLTTIAFGTWLLVGLFVDGWAHVNLAELETFFTPWHGLFYSGFTATGLWMLLLVHRRRTHGHDLRTAVPVGYGLGLVGLAIFAVGGVGDALWHTAFGIEADLDALFSPTHVLLFTGMVMILTSPLRAAWVRTPTGARPSWRVFGPALGGATLSAAMLVFAFMYWSPLVDVWPSTEHTAFALGEGIEGLATTSGMAALFTTVLLLVGPLGLLLRRWVPPRGAATVLFTVPALLASALGEFAAIDLVLASATAGALTDVAVDRLRPAVASPWRLRAVTTLAAAALTATYLVGVWATRGIGWAPEFTFGAVVWSAAIGLGLGTLVAPPPSPAAPTPTGAVADVPDRTARLVEPTTTGHDADDPVR
jgi:hypothetical protein